MSNEIGPKLKKLLKLYNITPVELGKKIGKSSSMIFKYYNYEEIDTGILSDICKLIDFPIERFFIHNLEDFPGFPQIADEDEEPYKPEVNKNKQSDNEKDRIVETLQQNYNLLIEEVEMLKSELKTVNKRVDNIQDERSKDEKS